MLPGRLDLRLGTFDRESTLALGRGVWWQSLYPLAYTRSPKLLIPVDANSFAIAWHDAGSHMLRQLVLRNSVTATESLGGSGETWRRTVVQRIQDGIFGRKTATAENGTWTAFNVGSGNIGSGATGADPLASAFATASGAYRDYPVVPDANGQVRVTFLGTGTTTQFAELAVAGGATLSTVNTRRTGAVNELRHFLVDAPGGEAFTLRVRHGSGDSANMYVVGVNTSLLSDAEPIIDGVSYDFTSCWWKSTDADFFYASNPGAQDYAFRDADADLYGGSIHGGETISSQSIKADGVATDHLTPAVALKFEIDQVSLIDWSGSGGGTADITGHIEFDYDGVVKQVFDIAASGTFARVLAGMSTTRTDFNNVTKPASTDATADGQYNLGTGQIVTQQKDSTSQRVTSICNSLSRITGGVPQLYVLTDSANSYSKAYFAPNYQDTPTMEDPTGVVEHYTIYE